MPLSTERLPNLPLSGPELQQYIFHLMIDELNRRDVPDVISIQMGNALNTAMESDFFFKAGAAYPHITITLSVQLHYAGEACAFRVQPSFAVDNPMAPKHSVFVRSSHPPLGKCAGDQFIVCFTLTAKADNPNLIRIHYAIPISVTKKTDPQPGEMFPSFESERLEFDPADYPKPTAPAVEDQSETFRALWIPKAEAVATPATASVVAPVERSGRRRGRNKA